MIEVKINFTSIAEAAQFFACVTEPARSGATAPGIATTLSPEAQQAARDSVAQGTAAGATGKPVKDPKPPKEPKPETKEPKPETKEPKAETKTPTQATADAIVASSTTTLPTYAESGLSELIAKAQLKDKDATIAAIRGAGGVNDEGKTKGSSVPPENYADLAALLGKIIGDDTALD
jgi:hypothetical protein